MHQTFITQYTTWQNDINTFWPKYLPAENIPPIPLHKAMHYSLKSGGKRLRPILVLATHALWENEQSLDPMPAAIAIEYIHTYSLIHDDLPCMDNSQLRRNHPTCHKTFGEATALLAGDALLTQAFLTVSENYPSHIALKLIQLLAKASSSTEMIGGQMADLLAEKNHLHTHNSPEETLQFIHSKKTCALITSALEMGAALSAAPLDNHILSILRKLGQTIGLLFQIVDDILDITTDENILGKTTGQDLLLDKLTYPKLYGLEKSKHIAHTCVEESLNYYQQLNNKNHFIKDLILSLEHRLQ